jgi:uncharacterized protein YabE (DUF348 family)/3D (Asp-Asp-Asp) domain-containing protein
MRNLSKRTLIITLICIGLGSLLVAGFLFAQEEITIQDGANPPITLTGSYATVGDALAAANIDLRPEDIVSPALDTAVSGSTPIRIQRAHGITVRTETSGAHTYWTQQPTLAAFLNDLGLLPQPTDQIYADGVRIPFLALGQTALPATLEIGRFLTISIQENGRQQTIRTAAQTVGAALQEAGITIYAADSVTPSLGSWLEPNQTIYVQRSFPVTIVVDGRTITTRTAHTNPLQVLAEAGIGLIGQDYTLPGPEAALQPNDIIQVIRVTEDFRTEDVPIPYQTVWQASDQLDLDTQALISAGSPGLQRQRIRIRYENGIPTTETVDGEWIAREPVNEVMGYGTNIVLRTLDTPEGPLEYWRVVRMRVTSYTAASSGKAPDHPAYGITASGLPASKGVVAVDRNVVPWRSWLYVPGYGKAFAGDTGGGVRGRWVDLGYGEDDYQSWSGYVDVYYLTPVPPADKINYILPANLP